jgi:hypothetical protein
MGRLTLLYKVARRQALCDDTRRYRDFMPRPKGRESEMNVVKIFFASLVVAGVVSGCSTQQDNSADAAANEAQIREAEEAARQAEEAAKRAEVAAEKAEVIFHKSLEK